jgi:hypothetical protein
VIRSCVPDGAHGYPDRARTAAERTMFTVAVGAAVQGLLVALAARRGGQLLDRLDDLRARSWCATSLICRPDWEPLGAIAIGYAEDLPDAAAAAEVGDRLAAAGEPARLGRRDSQRLEAPNPGQDALRTLCWPSSTPGPTPANGPASPGMSPRRLSADPW